MFKRITYDQWAAIIPVFSLCVFGAVFIIITIRALMMARAEREHLAKLPLQDDETPTHHSHV